MTNETYDIAVIGAGTGGLVAAFVADSLGAKTALIEKERVGGECLWTGCVPSKTLIKSARVFDTIKRSAEFGIHIEEPRVIWGAIKARIADVQSDIKKLEQQELKNSGITTIKGAARFESGSTLLVETKDGERRIEAKKFILATGTRPRIPKIEGLQDAGFITHEDVYSLPAFPRSMIILGGGPIGCEMAGAFARLGCKVSMIQRGETLLAKEDPEISSACQKVLENDGVQIHFNADARRAGSDDNGKFIVFEIEGQEQTARASQILVAIGKEAATQSLQLENAGVETNEIGVVVDDQLRTTAPNIWACGDITGEYLFTHVAEYQGKLAAQNALLPVKAKADYRVVPWVTFTDPEIAHLGLTEDEAHEQYGEIKVYRQSFSKLDRAIIEGETQGFAKIIATGSGRILGAHIIGPSAGELIHAFVPAVRDGGLIQEMAETIFAYPTLSEIAHRAGNEYYQELLQSKAARWVLGKIVGY